ncbi:MAG: L,D-transpeptidase family protein [Anaerolineaceae bacterium]|nr:L,D-transpeptidase family protein [Anaerolineaceae bacterium]MCB9101010.1 L,D-transpeptidase family protein [Anaerolineales bacterium]
MNTAESTRPNSPQSKLTEAINFAKEGHKSEAIKLLRQVVTSQPVNQAAWLWLSAVTEDRTEAVAAFKQAKAINPAHTSLVRAEEWLAHRFFEMIASTAEAPLEPPLTPSNPVSSRQNTLRVFNLVAFGLVVLAIIIGLIVLLLSLVWEVNATAFASSLLSTGSIQSDTPPHQTLTLELALAEQNWPEAIAILEPLHRRNPESVAVTQHLAYAQTQLGLNLRSRGFVEEALSHFETALALAPEQIRTQQEQRLARAYLEGVQHYQTGDWPAAIDAFESIWAESKSYTNVKDLLFSAYYNQGLALKASGAFDRAKASLEAATILHPEMSEPRQLLAEIEFDMAPETPLKRSLGKSSIQDRLILVSIAEQRMRVYEGHELVFDFIVSTGEPGRDTAIGDFEILNKIDNAYAATWNLDMPYWMGIYWSGPLQNGIHSLPIVKDTGYKLWDGYLGQRVSYGCVILSDEDAATLYDWTEVGTRIKIVPSFDYWSFDDEE